MLAQRLILRRDSYARLRLSYSSRWHVSIKDRADIALRQERQLYTKGDENTQYEYGDKDFKRTKRSQGPVRSIEQKDKKSVRNREGTARNQRDMWIQNVDSNGSADDLEECQYKYALRYPTLAGGKFWTYLSDICTDNGSLGKNV